MTTETRTIYYRDGYPVGDAPSYDGNAARKLERRETDPMLRTPPRRRRKSQRQTLQLREPGIISPFAVVGFALVVLLAALMLKTYSDLVITNDTAVERRSNLTALEEERTKLMTQYEQVYDLQLIEDQMLSSGTMIKKQNNDQVIRLELAEPDSVEYYQDDSVFHSLAEAVRGMISAITAYF